MLKVNRLTLFLILFISLAVAGCESQGDAITDRVTKTFTVTVTPVVADLIFPSRTPEQSAQATNTPTPATTDLPLEDQLVCGEIFCQVEWSGRLIRPFSLDFRNTIDLAYPYANTMGGILDAHHGVEFPNASGTPVRAVADGEVLFAGNDDLTLLGPYTGFYGNVVILHHHKAYQNRDLFSLYAHLSEVSVEEGEKVLAGQILGAVGASGAADGSHLHFEVRIDENAYDHTLNPVLWFPPVMDQNGSPASILAGLILDSFGRPLSEFEFVLEKLPEGETQPERFYSMTYVHYGVNAHPVLDENFVLPDIPPGEYRLAFIAGRLYEYTFKLAPGELGFIQIQLD